MRHHSQTSSLHRREPASQPLTWLGWGLPFGFIFTISLTLSGIGCGEDEGTNVRGVGGGRSSASSSGSSTKSGSKTSGSETTKAPPPPQKELPEAAFIETDENRDPFRSYLQVFAAQTLPEPTSIAPRPPVLLENVSIDDLRLIAIVSGEGGNPRAMVVDPEGKGWVVRRGDYIGRGETVRLGQNQNRTINWRVVRVRPDRIILVREDPIQAGPPVTRVMRLYPEGEE